MLSILQPRHYFRVELGIIEFPREHEGSMMPKQADVFVVVELFHFLSAHKRGPIWLNSLGGIIQQQFVMCCVFKSEAALSCLSIYVFTFKNSQYVHV